MHVAANFSVLDTTLQLVSVCVCVCVYACVCERACVCVCSDTNTFVHARTSGPASERICTEKDRQP